MDANLLGVQERPYHVDRTTSRPLCVVNRRRAWLVLQRGTTLEALVLVLFTFAHLRQLLYVSIISTTVVPWPFKIRLASIYRRLTRCPREDTREVSASAPH